MIKLYLTIAAIIAMAALIPFASSVALQPMDDDSLIQHFIYMFGHATVLHWAVNAWALLVLHNLFRPSRIIATYLLAVLISFLPPFVLYAATSLKHMQPILGASVITCFFFGLLMLHLWRQGERLSACMMAALIIIAFFIPGIAAMPHLLMFLAGILWYHFERMLRSFINFID